VSHSDGDAERLITAVSGGALPRHVWVRRTDLNLHALDWGAPEAPPVLLVHGNGGHAHWWDALVPYFLPAYRLIAVDLRGHGESDWPDPPAYRIEDFSADLTAVVEQLRLPRMAVIAHSMGARAAAWFAAAQPQRIRGLALLDTSLTGVDAETAQRWRGRMVGQREGRTYPSRTEALAAFRFVPPEPGVAEAIVADLAFHAVHERAGGGWAFRFDRAVLSLDGDGAGNIGGAVADLPCPLWVGLGSGSQVILRGEFRRLGERRPDLVLREFTGAHHFFLSDPRAAGVALREFVDALAP
jgi:pimeloyl-ACP methyl ester carboxylesterase